jgi:phosphatidylethanolamine-binding protein (PEBP) family uncharacterized protein
MRLTIDTYDEGEAGIPVMRIRRRSCSLRRGAIFLLSVALPIACAGCGTGSVGKGEATTAGAKPQAIALASPSMIGGGAGGTGSTIPVRYTCDGTDTTPSFRWGPVPPSAAELALFLFKVNRSAPASNGGNRVEVSVEWAVAGLSPRIHAISAGKLPHGAIAASKRYSICPAKGSPETYIFQLNAISHRLAVGPHFDAARLFQEAESSTVASGTFASSYKRV